MVQILIFIFGFIGGATRWLISLKVTVAGFPLATLLINLAGAFLLPYWNQRLVFRWHVAPAVREAVGVGLLGAFTTFSSASLDLYKLLISQNFIEALVYGSATILGGLMAAFLAARLFPVEPKDETAVITEEEE